MAAASGSGALAPSSPSDDVPLWTSFVDSRNLFEFPHQRSEFNRIMECIKIAACQKRNRQGRPCHVVCAPRGCGKTTLLGEISRYLAGATISAAGEIAIDTTVESGDVKLNTVYKSFRQPDESMGDLVTIIQRELGIPAETALSMSELKKELFRKKQSVAVFLDDFEVLYSEDVYNVAEQARTWDQIMRRDMESVWKSVQGLPEELATRLLEAKQKENRVQPTPYECGVYLAQAWLGDLHEAAVQDFCRDSSWGISVVICASQASSRRLLFEKVGDDESHIHRKYPLYKDVKTDLNRGKYSLGPGMLRKVWADRNAFHAFLDFKGIRWPTTGGEFNGGSLQDYAAALFIGSTSASVRCATRFCGALLEGPSVQTLESVRSALSSVPSAQGNTLGLNADNLALRNSLYEYVLGCHPGGYISGEASEKLLHLQTHGAFAYDVSAFATSIDLLHQDCARPPADIYRALDLGILSYTADSMVGIPSLRQLLHFLGSRLDPYEASCLTFTAGATGTDAEPIVGQGLLNGIRASAGAEGGEDLFTKVSHTSPVLVQEWLRAVRGELLSGRLVVSSSPLNWSTIQRFQVGASEPLLPDGATEGIVSFAKEHLDKYGGDLIAIFLPAAPSGEDSPEAPSEDVQPTADTTVPKTAYVWRVQVKLCSTSKSRISPGTDSGTPGPQTARGLCAAMQAGQPQIEESVRSALSAVGLGTADIITLNSVATTRNVSADSKAEFFKQGVALFDRETLAALWDEGVKEYAKRANLSMYLPPAAV